MSVPVLEFHDSIENRELNAALPGISTSLPTLPYGLSRFPVPTAGAGGLRLVSIVLAKVIVTADTLAAFPA